MGEPLTKLDERELRKLRDITQGEHWVDPRYHSRLSFYRCERLFQVGVAERRSRNFVFEYRSR
jgi:hypothetical protein